MKKFPVIAILIGLSLVGLSAGLSRAQSSRPTTQPTAPESRPASKPAKATSLQIPEIPSFIVDTKPNGKTMVIHYKTSFDHDDNAGCVAFNAALAALTQGYEVSMLYDAGGVFDLRLFDGEPASYHYEIPEKLKRLMVEQYPISKTEMPNSYREYLYWLHEMDVAILYNGFMAALVDIQDSVEAKSDGIEPIAEPLTLNEMLQKMEESDTYVVY